MATIQTTNYQDLVKFYRPKSVDGRNLFEIWDDGGSRGDSVTPSTYCSEYRNWMCAKLVAELKRTGGGLLSLGCGNAAVEAQVARKGFRVLAIDAMDEAVALAQRKGVPAVRADIFDWEPDDFWQVIYMDGVLGHLYRPEHGLQPVLARVRAWLAQPSEYGQGRSALVASNDAPESGAAVQRAPGVNGFHWLSADYMRDEALVSGFDSAATEAFRYRRPLSGDRVRAIITSYACF